MKKTPLNSEHIKLGAKLVEFAGYEMPVHYKGIVDGRDTSYKFQWSVIESNSDTFDGTLILDYYNLYILQQWTHQYLFQMKMIYLHMT